MDAREPYGDGLCEADVVGGLPSASARRSPNAEASRKMAHSVCGCGEAKVTKTLAAVLADCAQPVEAVFVTAVALTLHRYGHAESVSILAQVGSETDDWGTVVEVSLKSSPEMTVRQCVAHVAAQLGAAPPVEWPHGPGAPGNGVGTDSREVLRTDIHKCLAMATVRDEPCESAHMRCAERALTAGLACMTLSLRSSPPKATLVVKYQSDLVRDWLARQLARHVLRILREMARNMDRPSGHCAILTTAERRRAIGWSRGPRRNYPLDGGLKALFERRARSAPDAVALIEEDSARTAHFISYRELNAFANGVAREIRTAGAKNGHAVAVVMNRSIGSVGALVATVKAGSVFVPIDDSYPDEYVRRILQETAATAILAAPGVAERVVALLPGSTAVIPVKWPHDRLEAHPNPRGTTEANAAFLIMYTSGSMGKPKGVVHRQRQVLNRLHWMWEEYPFTAGELMCQRSPLTVMPSIWELLGGLLMGVPTVVAPPEVARDPARMAAFIARHGVTRLTLLPSLLERLLDGEDAGRALASLRFVTVGGEMLPSGGLYEVFRRKLPQCVLIEDYGCTEVNTILHSAVSARNPDVRTSAGGRPIANLGAYVLDRFDQLAPPGAIGELAVAGGSLATAYLGSSELYDQRFVTNDVDPAMGSVLYRTGDLAYYGPAGSIKLAGRADHQLKIRGMMLEPSEVEGSLALHAAVDECCAVSHPDPREGGELVVFVVPREGAQVSATELRAHLSDRLPPFMIPTRVIVTKCLPRTLSGKLDRRALAARAAAGDPAPVLAAAGGETRQLVRALLAQVLGQRTAEIADRVEFQLLGLDSLRTITFAERLSESLGMEVSATALFDHCTVAALTEHLRGRLARIANTAPELSRRPGATSWGTNGKGRSEGHGCDIAVIGMSGRFPDATTLDQLWSNLAGGRESVTEVPEDRWAAADYYDAEAARPGKSVSKWGAFLSGVRDLDPQFFRVSPADAIFMDPQHRIGLEEAWKAFEDAGYSPEALDGLSVGVFVGLRKGDLECLLNRHALDPDRATLLGNDPAMLAARIAFRMNLKGPSLTVDTACSSSLAAVHLACQSLLAGECDMAVAGGVCVVLSPDFYIATSKLGIFSPTGKCRAFDRDADGFVQGEGAGFVILKRLSNALRDSDNVHAVVKGTALNQDGRTNGIGAPSSRSQTSVQERVYRQCAIDPRTITYVEAHGTGTPLGDQIEIEALTRSFRTWGEERNFCAVGSVKTNIGHLTAAAGIAGLIKSVLCLKRRQIPPSLNFRQPNPFIRFEDTPFYVNDRLRPWEAPPGMPRRAAVNSFGLSGTNVHCVVEEAPERPEPPSKPVPGHLVLLSAETPGSLARQIAELRTWIRNHGRDHVLRDVAYTLLVGRERQRCVRTFVAADLSELEGLLAAAENDPCPRTTALDAAVAESGEAALCQLTSGTLEPAVRRGVLGVLGERVAQGYQFEVGRLYPPGSARRISLPTYPFERQTCWPPPELLRAVSHADSLGVPREADDLRQPSESPPPVGDALLGLLRETLGTLLALPPSAIDAEAGLDTYGYDSLVAVDLRAKLETALRREVPISILADEPSLLRLAARLEQSPGGVEGDLSEPPDDHSAPFPLTDMQAAYLFGAAASGDEVGCHTYLEFEVADLNVDRLSRAWNRLVEHHPMLRTRITKAGEQRVLDDVPWYEIRTYETADRPAFEEHLAIVRGELSHRLYEPGIWPLFDLRATLCSGRPAVVHVSMDSLLVDWESAEILYKTWYELYHAPATALAPLGFTFREYCAHLNAERRSESGQRQFAYWRRKLSACPDGPALPYARPASGIPARFRRHHASITSDGWEALKERAAALAVFPTSLVLACFSQTLAEACGEERFSIVLTHAHRRRCHPQVAQVVGPFTSTSICIVDRVTGRPLEELAVRLNAQLADDLHHRDVCAARVLGALARETGGIPSLPVVFTGRVGAGGTTAHDRPSWLDNVSFAVSQSPGVALESRVREVNGRLEVSWDVAETRLEAGIAASMLADFEARLEAAASRVGAQTAGVPEELPLTALQQVYLAERRRADSGRWAEGTVYQEFNVKDLDVARFKTALRQLFELEPVIAGTLTERACLRHTGRRQAPVIDVEDLRFAGTRAQARLDQVRTNMLASRALQDRAPSIRARLSILGRDAVRIHLAIDMAVADGFSVLLLYVRLFELCQASDRAPAAAGVTFVDHLARRHRERASRHVQADLAYWRQRVEQAPAGPILPRSEARLDDGGVPVTRLEAELVQGNALRARAAQRGLGLDSVLVAALNTVLAAWSEVRRPFNTVVALAARDRVAPDAPRAIGDFTAFSWVTEDLETRAFARRAAEVERTLATDLSHGRSSPIEARRRLASGTADRNGSHSVVFTGCCSGEPLAWPAGVAWGYGIALTPGADVDCYVHNLGGHLTVHWDYRRAALPDGIAADMFSGYAWLLERLAVSDDAWEVSDPLAARSLGTSPLSTDRQPVRENRAYG